MALSTKFYAPKRPPAFCETPVELVAGTMKPVDFFGDLQEKPIH